MKTILIHMGLHKTGTTAIQAALAKFRDVLLEQGYCYPHTTTADGTRLLDHHDLAHAIADQDSRLTDSDIDSCVRHWRDTDASRVHTFILSSESMSRHQLPASERGWAARRRAYLDRLRTRLQGFHLVPVVVLRRQDDYIRSLYQEHVRKGTADGSVSFAAFREKRQKTALHFLDNLRLIEDCLGQAVVLTYEDLIASGDLTRGFLTRLGIDVDALGELKKPSKRIRTSLSPTETALKLHINQHGTRFFSNTEAMYWLKSGAGKRCLRKLVQAGEIWASRAEREAFLETFAEDNEAIRHRYFPDRDTLFPPLKAPDGQIVYKSRLNETEQAMVDAALRKPWMGLLHKRLLERARTLARRWLRSDQ